MSLQIFCRLLAQYVAPQHALSRFAGALARSERPWLAQRLIDYFVSHYPINLNEALEPELAHYASFNGLFTRRLSPDARPLANALNAIVSPADGQITEFGALRGDQMIQAKGQYYSVDALLANNPYAAQQFHDGTFATIYLAPHNYHRVHAPCAGEVREIDYVPGNLFSVNTETAARVPRLFTRNERVILHCTGAHGPFVVILVGALLVGSIELADPVLNAEIASHRALRYALPRTVSFAAGAELGHFNLGSTVIVLFGRNAVQWAEHLAPGRAVRMGERLGAGAPVK